MSGYQAQKLFAYIGSHIRPDPAGVRGNERADVSAVMVSVVGTLTMEKKKVILKINYELPSVKWEN